jgi:Helix-turn-helix domain
MASNSQEVLAAELRRLHRSAGEPGTRQIAKAIKFSHTTVAQALNGSRCPKWNAIEAMVRHLGGDAEVFLPLWQAVRDAENPILSQADPLPTAPLTEKAARSALDLHSRTASEAVLTRVGASGFFTDTEDMATEMSRALADPSLTEVRLLGLSLSNWFGGRGRHRGTDWPGQRLERLLLGKEAGPARTGGIRVRVLLIDPSCLGLRLLTYGAGRDTSEELERLRNEIGETAQHLSRLSGDIARHTSNSLQLRFSRTVPPFFLFATQQSAFTRPYYQGLATDSDASAAAAVWHFSTDSSPYQATCRHFDTVWDADSVPSDELLRHKSIGTDRGISESGIVNIYTNRVSAQERIEWLVAHAKDRVWVQGVSLSHHLNPPLEEIMLSLLRRPSVDTRVLILDPDSDQAVRKSYRDYLLDQKDGAAADYASYAQDKDCHKSSLIYEKLRYSTQRFARMSAGAAAGNFHVRHYACAPTSYVLIADHHALIEQFHYGKPVSAEDSIQAQLQLAREMPLIEYARPESVLFKSKPWFNPTAVIEDHFSQVFQHFGIPIPLH